MYCKDKAVRVTAYFKDFDGDVAKWKNSFYELWRLQMTWSYAYQITVEEAGRQGNVFVNLVVKQCYARSLVDTMEDLGYKNIRSEKEYFLFAPCVDDDPDDEDELLDVMLD